MFFKTCFEKLFLKGQTTTIRLVNKFNTSSFLQFKINLSNENKK